MIELLKKFKNRIWQFDKKIGVEIVPVAYKLGVLYILTSTLIGVLSPFLAYQSIFDSLAHFTRAVTLFGVGVAVLMFKAVIMLVIWRMICEFIEFVWQPNDNEIAG